jgi:hypothetical protein
MLKISPVEYNMFFNLKSELDHCFKKIIILIFYWKLFKIFSLIFSCVRK